VASQEGIGYHLFTGAISRPDYKCRIVELSENDELEEMKKVSGVAQLAVLSPSIYLEELGKTTKIISQE
jgi:hypothetical protein